ncbi:MAG: sigma-54 dependent transcriptional regulator [Pseudomonadota bacterium]|nr:sigma-54 dependent transcriptional regulator [Pseudomonadota bacterium]
MPAKPTVLLVDDQPENLDVLVNYLADSGLELVVATEGEQALQLAAECQPDLVLLDVMMPGLNGFQVCERLKQGAQTQSVWVIFMSALTDTQSKVKGFAAGAIDYVSKPLQREEVLARIQAHLTIRQQQAELLQKNLQLEALNRDLQHQMQQRQRAEEALHLADQKLSTLTRQEAERWGIDAFVGQSQVTKALLDEVRSLQRAPSTNVLVLGESGTGKELISRAIHFGSARSQKPFVAVNCSAIPTELADAEFFGHIKGAYTGAVSDRHGYFVQADGGTLFLDEIGDMPSALQAKLLRVLEDGLVTPIGGRQSRKVDVRVVAATNVNLLEKVREKAFRQDLFFRLAGYQIAVPPLRNRVSDIPLLVEHFLLQLGSQMGRERPTITREAMQALSAYAYPGNVRELRNLVEYALIASRGRQIDVAHLHFLQQETVPGLGVDVCSAGNAFDPEDNGTAPDNQEESLLAYTREHGRVDNTSAQALLGVSHSRASYLLKKLHKEGQLAKQGQRRWSYYVAQ